jgi:PBP1b-binding outer membrane lipoprotein LpoB
MKKVLTIVIMMCLFASCKYKQDNKASSVKRYENTVVVIVTDNSTSFVRHSPRVSGTMLKPLCEKIVKSGNIDMRIGRDIANSHIEFLRFTKKRVTAESDNSNPWLDTGSELKDTVPQNNWEFFASSLEEQANRKPVKRSDIGGMLSHSLLIFQEYQHNTRKILLISTDYKNNGLPIPAIDPGIEIISVGTLPDVLIEKILHTHNIKRFESMQTAIEYILSTY